MKHTYLKEFDVKQLLFCLLFLGICQLTTAQRGWEIGAWAGTSTYFGDLNTNYDLSNPGLSGGFIGRYNFNDRVCFKLSGNYGQVSASDANSRNAFERARNLSFESILVDGTAQLEFNFLPYNHGSKDEFYTPYLFAGFNVFHFNPKTEYEGQLVELRPLGTEGQFRGEEYGTIQGGLVFGGGFKIDLSYEWSINIEISSRYLFTDYLDDVSTVYADRDDIEKLRGETAAALSDRSILLPGVNDAQIGEPGRQRGDSNVNDSFVFLGIGFLYYFGDLRCPEYGRR